MNIVFLCHRIPYPPNKGDKIRSFNMLKYLAKKHRIYSISLHDDKKDKKYLGRLDRFRKKTNLFYINPFFAKIRSIFYLFSTKPVTLGYFFSKRVKTQINTLLKTEKIDLIFVYSSSTAQYVIDTNLKKVMDFADCDSAKWKQYSGASRFPMSFVYAREFRLLREYEKKIIQSFDRLIVTTEKEKGEFSKFVKTDKFSILPSGVDTDFFKPEVPSQAKRTIFTGDMSYFANIEGISYFCGEIFPLIKKRISEAEFCIVGRNPTFSIKLLTRIKGISVTGEVQDIREYLSKSSVCVVPLRISQGVQNKILEAMASGLPVVTTSKAASGLKAEADKEILVADNPKDFAEKVIMLLGNSDFRSAVAKSARMYVEENHDWEKSLSKLENIIE